MKALKIALAVVVVQHVAGFGSQRALGFCWDAPRVLFFCLAMWLGGCVKAHAIDSRMY